MKKLILICVVFLLMNSCVTIKSGDTTYRRFWGKQQIESLKITIDKKGIKTITLKGQGSDSGDVIMLMKNLSELALKAMVIP